jgi:hypothetical protein
MSFTMLTTRSSDGIKVPPAWQDSALHVAPAHGAVHDAVRYAPRQCCRA